MKPTSLFFSAWSLSLLCPGFAVTAQTVATRSAQPVVGTTFESRIDAAKLPQAISRNAVNDQLSIDTSKLDFLKNISVRAVDLNGNKIQSNTSGDVLTVAAKASDWVVIQPVQSKPMLISRKTQWLPGFSVVEDHTGTAKTFSTYVRLAIAPVVWNLEKDAYEIIAVVGVARDGDEKTPGPLGQDAKIKLSFDGIPVNPAELTINQLGIEGEQEVRFLFNHASKARPSIIVRSSIANEQDFTMPITPRLSLSAKNNPVLGFGLSRTIVTARPVDAMGRELTGFAGRDVDIEVDGGDIVGSEAWQFDESSKLAFAVISSDLGNIVITAMTRSSEQSLAGSLTIGTKLPWPQLLAAILGGVLGGFCRRFVKGARKTQSLLHIVEGASVSIIAFVAGVLGVGFLSLPAVIVATVGGAFLTGSIAGFLGVMVLEKLSSPGGH